MGQGRCNREVKFLGKLKKDRGGGGGQVGGRGSQGGCEQRIKVLVKIKKKSWGGGSG